MRTSAVVALLLVATLAPLAAQQAPCAGEFSRCPTTGACALVPQQCAQCPSGQYACPMSSACVPTADAYTTCPGLKDTHFDATLTVEQRLDYIFAQSLSVAELITQMVRLRRLRAPVAAVRGARRGRGSTRR